MTNPANLKQADELTRLAMRQIRNREEAIGPVAVRGGRPTNPRPGQLVLDLDVRDHLRWNVDANAWEEVDQHRPCGHWIRRGDPVAYHVHECIGDEPPTLVYECSTCEAKYRVPRNSKFSAKECLTCQTPWAEDQPRAAIADDFR